MQHRDNSCWLMITSCLCVDRVSGKEHLEVSVSCTKGWQSASCHVCKHRWLYFISVSSPAFKFC